VIYFDAAYIVKCYVPEKGHAQVRGLLHRHQSAVCCAFGRLEFAAAIQRAIREGRLPETTRSTVFSILSRDDRGGVWNWIPLTPHLLETAVHAMRLAPTNPAIRAADALHLVCAKECGCHHVYTNDRQMLAAAPHFGVQATNVID